jgi:hypothetical protein
LHPIRQVSVVTNEAEVGIRFARELASRGLALDLQDQVERLTAFPITQLDESIDTRVKRADRGVEQKAHVQDALSHQSHALLTNHALIGDALAGSLATHGVS